MIGVDYDEARDGERFSVQHKRIFDLMKDGRWRTLPEICEITGDPHASVSAQLRHFRKKRFGSHTVKRSYIENGLYEYKLSVNPNPTGK